MSGLIGGRAWVPLYRAGAGRRETPAEDDLELRLRGPRRLHNPHRGGREAEQGALEPALLLLLLQLHHEEQLQASQGMKSQRPCNSKSAFSALYPWALCLKILSIIVWKIQTFKMKTSFSFTFRIVKTSQT